MIFQEVSATKRHLNINVVSYNQIDATCGELCRNKCSPGFEQGIDAAKLK